jgi:glycerol-3-phosphate dehydrogenase subunit C
MCIKCNICTAACPVAAVSDEFLGPKAVGPQAERFRHPQWAATDPSVTLCSGCGVCSRVCPHGVPVAELNIRAKGQLASHKGVPLRDRLIARPAMLGALAQPLAPLANAVLRARPARVLAQAFLGLSRSAPMPQFSAQTFRSLEPAQQLPAPLPPGSRPQVAYFHGCSVNYYEPGLGRLTLRVLDHLGFDVWLPPQGCCGLPLQSNGQFAAARRYAQTNVRTLAPFAAAGVPIVGTSTSCTLALKHDYRAILGLETEEADLLAGAVYDIFEFLRDAHPNLLDRASNPVPLSLLYHAPCQLNAHGVGMPAYDVLRRIPGLSLTLSESECCGVAGTYGLKSERYSVAFAVGSSLFDQIRQTKPDLVVTDSETCRWWVEGHTGVRTRHPIEILAVALGLQDRNSLLDKEAAG